MQHRNVMERGRGEDGISEVVGFVIILAVVMAGLSLYLTYAVPVQGREVEIKEMDSVRTWFVDYKTGMDQLWLNSPLVPNDTTEIDEGPALFNSTVGQVTLRKVINAGTAREGGFIKKYFPVLAPLPASAEVSVRDGEWLEIWAKNDAAEYYLTPNLTGTALGYASHNNYWFQQQYYYQLGGVFLRQWDQTGGAEAENVTMIAAPPLSIHDDQPGVSTKVEFVAVNLEAEPGGFGATSPIRVETRLETDPVRPVDQIGKTWPAAFDEVSLLFRGASPQAAEEWAKAFNGAASRNSGMVEGSQYNVTYPWSGDDTVAVINVTGYDWDGTTNDVMLELLLASYTMKLGNVPTMIE